MVINMLLDLGLCREPPSAVWHRAAKRSVSLMRPGVLIQNCLLSKILSALSAFVRLFARMDPQMLIQDGSLPEIPTTVDATVRFLIRVYSQMLRQMRLLPESFTAFRTRIWPRFNMYATVL